ncbi:prepilin-type N-terminal cleavage/methylation domain-containing protein [Burkholderiales bacterium JOSHI_001]|nr:prepilin-type N-terminal cleavage/methylation domain-containing protein [Burkholderiales bacterium JOSHI_001]
MRHLSTSRSRGFTLLELMLAVTLVGVLASMALPSFGSAVSRQRLKTVSQTLAVDMAEARHEAVRSGRPLKLVVREGRDWCWAITDRADADCHQSVSGAFRQARAVDHPGLNLLQATGATFGTTDGVALQQGGAMMETAIGDRVRVRLSPLGRTSLCSPNGAPGFVPCVN